MQSSLFLLLGAAAAVALLHSILPDHWVPLAVIARTRRWSLLHVVRVSAFASLGHVITSLVLAGIIAVIGLQFRQQIEIQQGHIVGGILVITGLLFLIWGLVGHGAHRHLHAEGHTHQHTHEEEHTHDHEQMHEHATDNEGKEQTLIKRLGAIAVPFGVAASPDLTILPVALAASAIGTGAVIGTLCVFSVLTLATFVGLTVLATLAGYQIKGVWLEKNANTITAFTLIIIGVIAFIGF